MPERREEDVEALPNRLTHPQAYIDALAREVARLSGERDEQRRIKLHYQDRFLAAEQRLGEMAAALREPLCRLGDSLDGPGNPDSVFLIYRESTLARALAPATPEDGGGQGWSMRTTSGATPEEPS